MCFAEEHKYITSNQKEKFKKQNCHGKQLQLESRIYLLKAVIESFVDGILILTTQGELLQANECARQICQQTMRGKGLDDTIPKEIWRVCESLIDSRELFPEERVVIESEIETDKGVKLRIRARWLALDTSEQNAMVVILEDRNQTHQSMAFFDVKKYGLTDREAEVWLLRQANLSYREIAERLYITINTVKKHLKNIYAKQQETLWMS
ncbi:MULTISPECIES: helix-turn-helix transcriptional regulator [Nostocales]|uniref:LuxR family transcriptional regulator n=2 Tax=Nostocales TaxID=1161 RepID=A0A0C1N7L6_9CYAN|nr:helix-turn-helix transcriptional regulator [Tolypothrix bouteillei]KAF3886591.1 winged helix-turn-helix transcriptional regulator [Tolypothrix bouteillei VB521301]